MDEPLDRQSPPCPARPEKLTVEFYETPDGIAIRKNRGGGPGVFLFIWLIGWTVGCVFLAANVVKNPAIGTIAFALPFWVSWLFVAAFLVWIVFGKETLVLRSDKALFQRKAFFTIASREVPRQEIRSFREYCSTITENDAHLWGIEMVTLGKPLRFAFRLPDLERAWLLFQLNQYLASTGSPGPQAIDAARLPVSADSLGTAELISDTAPGSGGAAFSGGKAALADGSLAVCEVLDKKHTLSELPTDSQWRLDDDASGFRVWQRGRFKIGSVAGALFINLFWNGIVGVFVMHLFGLMPNQNQQLRGGEWWGLFVFLIPFEVIGLVMVAALVFLLFEPFHYTIWRFESDWIEKQSRWPIYRRTRVWEVVKLDRMELRRPRAESARRRGLADPGGFSAFGLAFVSTENVDLCCIADLTEGEARWIAHLVFERRARWFRR